MLRNYSRKACVIIATTVVMTGASIMLNDYRKDEFVEITPEEAGADAAVDAEHDVQDAQRIQAAVRGLMVKAQASLDTRKQLRPAGKVEKGIASSYGNGFNGRKTANGEIYNQNTYTAAHKKLPFGTKVLVKNLRNGREVVVRINNRGPYVRGRIIDVSLKAARDLGMLKAGVVPVEVTVLAEQKPVLASAE